MEAIACARAVKAIAAAIALPLLSACAGLHLDQQPDQVIQRTEGEDNYAQRQKAGPVAARVLPYALLAEQSYDPTVYATHRIAPRATACADDDPKDCDARADGRTRSPLARRLALCLELQWRGRMRSADRYAERAGFGRLGGPNLGAQGRPMSRSGHRLSRNRRRRQGRLGIRTSTGSCALFPSTISTSRSATTSTTSSAISNATSATARGRPRSSPSATRSAAVWRSLRPIRIHASGASTPSIPRW